MSTEHQKKYAEKMASDDKTCEHGLEKEKCKDCSKNYKEHTEPDKKEAKESKKEAKKEVKDEEKKEKYPVFRRNKKGHLSKV